MPTLMERPITEAQAASLYVRTAQSQKGRRIRKMGGFTCASIIDAFKVKCDCAIWCIVA